MGRRPLPARTPGPGGLVTIQLRTGQTHPSRPEHFITKQTAVAPAPKGTPHPMWSSFLETVTDGRTELVEYLQRVAGYCLTGEVKEHAVFWTPIPQADHYVLQIEYFALPTGQEWLSHRRFETPEREIVDYFVGAQPGRWRVWAVYPNGTPGPVTDWREFRFTI